MKQKGKVFYGWYIVAACLLLNMVPMVFIMNTFSYYQVPITTEFGASYVQFSIANIAGSVANLLFSFFLAGRLAKGNVKRYMLAGGLLAGAAVFVQSYIPSIFYLYLGQLVINFCFAATTYIPINILISRWFVDKKGLVTSIVFMGTGIGGMLFSPVVAGVIADFGWRTGFRMTGVVTAVVAVLVSLLIVNAPQDKGLEPYREKKADPGASAAAGAAPPAWPGLTKGEAVKTASFWMYAVVLLCCGMNSAGIITQLPTFLVELKLDYAAVIAVYSGAAILAKLLLGLLFDKLGLLAGTWIAMGLNGASLLLLTMAGANGALAYAAAVLMAFGISIGTMLPPLLTSKLFGLKGYGGIYGLGNAFYMAGCMIGPVLSTSIRTATGAYNGAWFAYIAISVVLGLCTLTSAQASRRFQKVSLHHS